MKNKEIVNGTHYKGLPIMKHKGPFYADYLEKLHEVTFKALTAHPRTAAFRFDLHLPSDYYHVNRKQLICRFMDSLKGKIWHSREKAKQTHEYAHKTDVRYVWALEYNQDGKGHYHLVLFLNYDAIRGWGLFKVGRQNLFNRVLEAWHSALGITNGSQLIWPLVHVAENGVYQLDTNAPITVDVFFMRASYLAKVATKQGSSRHSFGGSRR
ncbi:MAG: inovirus Gp2 family protein [Pseudomonas sp.]|nr:inovirus Gp2 family protein [Pseudomonas sp.]